MHTKRYRMYFNYDNDKKVYVLPVLPGKIKITSKGQTTSVDIEKFGEVLCKGKREAITISFSSYFPAIWSAGYCACMQKEFKNPQKWHAWLLALQNAKKPCHFVLEGSPFAINMYADITSYVGEEAGGDVGTISYTVELKEHRVPKIKTYVVKTTSENTTAKVTESGNRVNNQEEGGSYTIKNGDNLWNISKAHYGKGARYTEILDRNRAALDSAAQKYGYSDCKNGNLIFPGTQITIP